jgi:hypothetical protein
VNSHEARRHFEEQDPYWNDQRALGTIWHRGRAYPLQLRSHVETERYISRGAERLFPLTTPRGSRDYVQSRLWVPGVPEGFRLVGGAQAWYYPADRAIVLWELLLQRAWEPREADPREQHLYRQLWRSYEAFLRDRFPTASTIMTTWEDAFPRDQWAGFLGAQGYEQTGPAVFTKPLSRPTPMPPPSRPDAG